MKDCILIDNTAYSLDELNKMFGGDCSTIELRITGSQGVTPVYTTLKYGEDFTTLEDVRDTFFEALSNNAIENVDSYLEDMLPDGIDLENMEDELDEDELNDLKGEAQAEAEIDSGERLLVVPTSDGCYRYYNVDYDEFDYLKTEDF